MTKIFYKNEEITVNQAKKITVLKAGHTEFQELFFYCPEMDLYSDYESLNKLGLYMSYADSTLKIKQDSLSLKKRAGYRPFSHSFDPVKHFGKEHDFGVKSASHVLTGGIKNTFGVEMEVCRGFVPYQIANFEDINVNCEFDGSLRDPDGKELGSEFITGVLTGDQGLLNLQKLCNVLSDRCLVDKRCGLHVHIGVNPTASFIVAAYKLANDIQDEMFSFVSPSRKNNDTCGLLKDHRSVIKEFIDTYDYYHGVKEAYNYLYEEFSNKRPLNKEVNKRHMHPGKKYTDRYSNPAYADIRKLYRYKIINFIPCTFNMRQKQGRLSEIPYTLEFRCHQGTTSFRKVKNWVLLCLAFVNFVENNTYKILTTNEKYSLFDILEQVYGKERKIYYPLVNYFKKRQELFNTPDCEKNELVEYDTPEKITLSKIELLSI